MFLDTLVIQSHQGEYPVEFGVPFIHLDELVSRGGFFLIDSKVANLYSDFLRSALESDFVLKLEAGEQTKSLENVQTLVQQFLNKGIRKNNCLVCIGGGTLQDLTAFLASILFRGIDWYFYPTTLLSQVDNCIGSKSSINVGGYKNQIGSFYPPKKVFVSVDVLDTLGDLEFRSGLGEMIKAFLIAGGDAFEGFRQSHSRLRKDKVLLRKFIRDALGIKKAIVEKDEFERAHRWILNYGHTFGHAVESASRFAIPHGIAITMGMDMANFVSFRLGFMRKEARQDMQSLLRENMKGFERISLSLDEFFEALAKDKKTVKNIVSFVLLKEPGNLFLYPCEDLSILKKLCHDYFVERGGFL